MEHVKKMKEWGIGGGFHYNNVPTYNEGEALNELEGTIPGIDIDDNNMIIQKK